jgi:hypothetical protein
LFKIVKRTYNNAFGVDTTPQSPQERVVSYALEAYKVFMEWAVI